MAKFIKNADSIDHTWSGQSVVAGSYYEIQPAELVNWQTNSQLLTDIGNAIAIVSSAGDSSGDIANVSAAIDFLKDNMAKEVVTQMEKSDKGLRLASDEVTFTGNIARVQIQIPGDLGTIGRYIAGGYAFTDIYYFGDRISKVELIDKDFVYAGLAYPATPFAAGVPETTEETTWADIMPDGVVLGAYHDSDAPEGQQGWRLWCDDGNQGGVDIDPLGGYGDLYAQAYISITCEKKEASTATKIAVNLWWGKKV